MSDLRDSLEPCAFHAAPPKLYLASYIDNIYACSTWPSGATAQIDLFFKHLAKKWGLRAQPSSLKVLPVSGCSDLSVASDQRKVETKSEVLGWIK
jgi:hypothetical protein